MIDIKLGGCPSCGKASCVAGSCRLVTQEQVAFLEANAPALYVCAKQANLDNACISAWNRSGHVNDGTDIPKMYYDGFMAGYEAVSSIDSPPGRGLPFGIIDPDYAKFYTMARILAWSHGYALAIHGSFTRDLDVLLIPWTPNASDAWSVVLHLASSADLGIQGSTPTTKEHGRLVWTLLFKGFGDPRWIDLSVMPRTQFKG